jgi:hypothetical protein
MYEVVIKEKYNESTLEFDVFVFYRQGSGWFKEISWNITENYDLADAYCDGQITTGYTTTSSTDWYNYTIVNQAAQNETVHERQVKITASCRTPLI